MSGGILGTNAVVQIGVIVKDIEKTGRKYAEFFGVDLPPVKVTATVDKTNAQFKGKPMPGRTKQRIFKLDNIEIELLEPDEGASTWREFLDNSGEGIHHIAFRLKGMEEKIARLEASGMELVQAGDYIGGRYAYMDSLKDLKVMIELLENY
jgi:methylmalonyl-CoA/ethylmalonyl-CoA epimerase